MHTDNPIPMSVPNETRSIPKAFLWRRLHSLLGIGLTFYLIFHLFTNSQAALLFGKDATGFINAVNNIQKLPYLPVLEILLIALPFIIHAIWGFKYLRTAEYNAHKTDGSKPALPEYARNRAYSWQRITSWILLFGIAAHVIHMRFWEHPTSAKKGDQEYFTVRLDKDQGLETLSKRLDVKLYTDKENQVIAEAKDFGTAELLMVREVFKSPLMMLLYTLLVITACYHGFNGLWTASIKWGMTPTYSQKGMLYLSYGLMSLVLFLGLVAIWGTYWINLRY